MEVTVEYGTRSFGTADAVSVAASRPVAFAGELQNPVMVRRLLTALRTVVLGDFRWVSDDDWSERLDPVVTVHPDQVIFEAFSNDMSTYGWVSGPLSEFGPQGRIEYGTTNIDFNLGLLEALRLLRSGRSTTFSVQAGGIGLATGGHTHFEKKVDLPDAWVRGFVQVQAALDMTALRLSVHPSDLLTIMAWVREHKPPRPPHGLRFQLSPDEDVRVIAEPWDDQVFRLRDTRYRGGRREIRVWGRRRLELLSAVLPYADRVTIGLVGRGMPHWYVCDLGPYRFALVLTGWNRTQWSEGFWEGLGDPTAPDPEDEARVRALLQEKYVLERSETGKSSLRLCQRGEAMLDPVTQRLRWRPLFPEPLPAWLLAPDPRVEQAQSLFEQGAVHVQTWEPTARSPFGRPETHSTAVVTDDVAYNVRLAVDAEEQVRFAQCTCEFFRNNLLGLGPCRHILAARLAVGQRAGGEQPVQKP